MKQILTVGELKKALEHFPDETQVWAESFYSRASNDKNLTPLETGGAIYPIENRQGVCCLIYMPHKDDR